MKQISVGTVIAIALLSVGCGQTDSNREKSPGWSVTNLSDSYVPLEKKDSYCVRTFDSSSYSSASFQLIQFLNGSLTPIELFFEDQLSGNYVESRNAGPISGTFFGQEKISEYDATYSDTYGRYIVTPGTEYIQEEVEGRNLNVCPGTPSYDAFSYEGAGLAISHSISSTYKAIKSVSTMEIEQITIQVAPTIKKNWRYRGGQHNRKWIKGYDTDNAYYNSEKKEITFLPQSERYQQVISKVPFWQIPMVGAHEYGHHVFHTLVIEEIMPNFRHSEACFDTITTLSNQELANAVGGARNNSFGYALGSLNEGFADLISFYALSNQERALKNVKCFVKNREVQSEVFGSGHKKIFTKTALSIMDSPINQVADRSCDTPNFQDTHHVGAVFANVADKIMTRAGLAKEDKLRVILDWGKALSQYYPLLENDKAGKVVFNSIELLLYQLEKDSEANDYDCSDLSEFFPDSSYACQFI